MKKFIVATLFAGLMVTLGVGCNPGTGSKSAEGVTRQQGSSKQAEGVTHQAGTKP